MDGEDFALSEGALETIMRGGSHESPIMQVLSSKKIASGNAQQERFRILLSDGLYLISYAMVTSQVSSGEIPCNSIIKIKQYRTSLLNTSVGKASKRVLVILEMELVKAGHNLSKIGTPVPLPDELEGPENGVSSTSHRPPSPKRPTNYGNGAITTMATQNVSLQNQMIHPITSLSPYQNRWVILARVTNKSAIRTWSNSRGEGKLFSMDLADESGEIRATVFRDLVDKYFEMIEVDKLYYISKCILKQANKQFNSLKNDYEMTFTSDTVVQECFDKVSVPQTHYSFIPIDKIAHMDTGTTIDVIGVSKSASDVQSFVSRTSGRELKKREVTLVDQTNNAISLTLWGSDAEGFDGSSQPVVVIKGAKIGEFGGGKNISMFMGSTMRLNPDIPESHRLRGWFDNGGMEAETTNISARASSFGSQTNWMSIKQAREANLGHSEKGDYYKLKATILLYRSENAFYKACPTADCNKKIVDLENGMYRCEKCSREYPNFKYRLLASVNLGDWSGNQWVSFFSNEAEKILGMTAQEVGEEIENNSNSDAMAQIADKVCFKEFIIICRAKVENYNDESRVKTVGVKVEPMNFKAYNAHIISQIEALIN